MRGKLLRLIDAAKNHKPDTKIKDPQSTKTVSGGKTKLGRGMEPAMKSAMRPDMKFAVDASPSWKLVAIKDANQEPKQKAAITSKENHNASVLMLR